MEKLAIFDIDYTITRKETLMEFFKYIVSKDIKNIKFLPRALYSGLMYGVKVYDEKKVKELLKFMNLDENLKIKTLSKGMLEKLNLSLTLSRKAKLYILDEPISGVDIVSREKIIAAIIDNIGEDSSMIITTHYVGELEGVFDEVAFLDDGKIVEINDAEVLREKYGKSIEEIYKYIFAE